MINQEPTEVGVGDPPSLSRKCKCPISDLAAMYLDGDKGVAVWFLQRNSTAQPQDSNTVSSHYMRSPDTWLHKLPAHCSALADDAVL